MPVSTWNIQLTGSAGTSKYIPTVQHTVTLSGGTARALDSFAESGAFEQLVAALERGIRHVCRQFKLGNVPDTSSVSLLITIANPGLYNATYTPSVKTGATPSGTNSALQTLEVGEARNWQEALERARRHVLNQIAQGV